MSFLSPWVAVIAGAVAVPTLLILYFLRLKRREVEVSTTLLWRKAVQDLQANAPFQKLRRNILLLLQLIVLVAVLVALAQPRLRATAQGNQKHIILIDRSASMLAPPSAEQADRYATRFDQAKERALEIVEGLREPAWVTLDEQGGGEEAMIVAFGGGAEVVVPFTSNKSRLRDAINGLEPTHETTSLRQAIELARAHTGMKKFEEEVDPDADRGWVPTATPSTLHVISDGNVPDAEDVEVFARDTFKYYPLGEARTGNVGITGLRSERAFDDPMKLSIFVGLTSTWTEAREVELEVAIDGVLQSVFDVPVGAAKEKGVTQDELAGMGEEAGEGVRAIEPGVGGIVVPVSRAEGGVVSVRVVGHEPDGLGVDDTAYLVVPPARRLSVAVATRGNFFLMEAMAGMGLSKVVRFSPEQMQRLVDGERVQGYGLGDFDVTVLDRWLPVVGRDAESGAEGEGGVRGVPAGRSLVLGGVPDEPAGLREVGQGGITTVISWSRQHPALKYAGLENLIAQEASVIELDEAGKGDAVALAQSDKGVLIAEISTLEKRALVVGFDVAESNWPFSPGWVLFLATSMTYLGDEVVGGPGASVAGGAGEIGDGGVRPGSTLTTRLPLGAQDVRLQLPGGGSEPLVMADDGTVVYEPIERIGLYTVSWEGAAGSTDSVRNGRVERVIPVNLLSVEESSVGTASTLNLPHAVVSAEDMEEGETDRELWPWLVLAGLVVVMLEWFVYNRKVQV